MDILGKPPKKSRVIGERGSKQVVVKDKKWTAQEIAEWLDQNRHLLTYPEATIGDEPGSLHQAWEKAEVNKQLKVCMVAWNGYMQLMGSLTIPMLVKMVNEKSRQIICERAFFPNDSKEMNIYRKNGLPIFSLESKHSLREFDVLGFSVAVTGVDINVVHMLKMCGIPIYAKDRKENHPIVIKGGVSSGNVSPIGAFYDICYIGEAEAGFVDVLLEIRRMKLSGKKKSFILKTIALKFEGIYVPAFYQEMFDPKTKLLTGVKVKQGMPKVVQRKYVKDVNKGYIYRHPLIHYGGRMGLGELLASRGCDNTCSFCNESLITKPYREYDSDLIVEALKTNMNESGADSVLPSAFCLSGHSQRSTIIKRLYEDVSDDVKLVSQRTDDFANDPGYVHLSRKAGNYNVSLGIEGLSQRLRDLVNKNITEEDILYAVRHAIEAGYSKIKFFMLGNLPGETEEDRQEFVELAKKIVAIRANMKSSCRLHFNWTNLNIVDHSPFQWFAPNIEGRSLHRVLKELKKLNVMVGFGASKSADSDFFSQLMFLGDSRLCSIVADLALEFDCMYFRGIKKGTKEFVRRKLAEKGLCEGDYLRARGKDEKFPWDTIDFGITKEFLWKRHQECKEGVSWKRCKEKCSGCGACDIADKKIMSNLRVKTDCKLSVEEVKYLTPVRQKGTVQKYLLRIEQDADHRFLSKVVRRMILRRALYMVGLPTTKNMSFASDNKALDNWIYGIDYANIPLHTHVFDMEDKIKELNDQLVGLKILDFRRHPPGVGDLKSNYESCLYEMAVNVSEGELRNKVEQFILTEPVKDDLNEIEGRKRTSYIKHHMGVIRIRVPGNRGEIIQELIDTRPMVRKMKVSVTERGVILSVIASGLVTVYHVYQAMTRKSRGEVGGLLARRIDFYSQLETGLFGRKCRKCGVYIPKNLFNEHDEDHLCVLCDNQINSVF